MCWLPSGRGRSWLFAATYTLLLLVILPFSYSFHSMVFHPFTKTSSIASSLLSSIPYKMSAKCTRFPSSLFVSEMSNVFLLLSIHFHYVSIFLKYFLCLDFLSMLWSEFFWRLKYLLRQVSSTSAKKNFQNSLQYRRINITENFSKILFSKWLYITL